MTSTDGDGVDTPQSRHLWGVWPTELGEEWNQRTRYGKLRYLVNLPPYVALWAVLLIFAAIMAVGYYGLVVVWRLSLKLSSWWPDTHRDRGESNVE